MSPASPRATPVSHIAGMCHWHCLPTATLQFLLLFLSFQGQPRKPSLKPGCLRPQQLPSISIREPSPKRGQKPPLLRGGAGGCRQTASAVLGSAARSLIYHLPTTRACPASPATGRGRAAPRHQPGLIRFGPCQRHLAAQERSTERIRRRAGAWGTHPELIFLWELTSSSVRAPVIY